jgi:hypothetical protein
MYDLFRRPLKRVAVAAGCASRMVTFCGLAHAQDMQTFLNNLNGQMSSAYNHYRAGVNIYNSVPPWERLDYKCANGDMRACWLHSQQLENAGRI